MPTWKITAPRLMGRVEKGQSFIVTSRTTAGMPDASDIEEVLYANGYTESGGGSAISFRAPGNWEYQVISDDTYPAWWEQHSRYEEAVKANSPQAQEAASNNNQISSSNNEQRESVGGFFAKVLIAAAIEADQKGKIKPVTKHAKKPAPKKPGEPKAMKKPAPIPKRQIGKPVVNRSSMSISTGGSSIGSASPKKKLFSGTKPVKAKPIKPAKPIASATKKQAIAKASSSKPSSIHTTTKKSESMFGGSTKKSSTSSSHTTSKKSGGMFGGSSKKSSGIGIMGGKKRR